MPTNLEIWQAANVLVQKHAELAAQEAEKHLAGVVARGDAEGEATWRRVMEAIPQLLATKPDGGVFYRRTFKVQFFISSCRT